MRIRQSLSAPAAWLTRAARYNGPERGAFVQSVKAAIAAVVSWVVAAEVLSLPQPFLAPYTAVFVVEATVYRSVRYAAQQLAAIVGAVVVAGVTNLLIPSTIASIGVATLAGLLIGQWHRLGSAGPWVGITALVIITFGTSASPVLLLDRLLESALGVAVGTFVNAVLFPPVYASGAREAVERLGDRLAELLGGIADGLRRDEVADHARDWGSEAEHVERFVVQAEQAVQWGQESRRLNIRTHTSRVKVPDDQYRFPLATLRSLAPYIRQLADALRAMADEELPSRRPGEDERHRFAGLLDALARTVRLRGDPGASEEDLTKSLEDCRERLDELDEHLTSDSPIGPAMGLVGMLIPVRRALRELEAR
ncbi:FUSC family protein [Prauserella flavalba]|uniref:FUSC family protein n=1 Tax=Prauserella flavalba TaxID=1477506 RepID=UPI0036EEFA5F